MAKRKFDLAKKLAAFDQLSDDAIVPDRVSAALLNIATATLRRNDPVARRQITERCFGRRAGDLRALIRGGAA
jgi:hypothetical protein